MRAEQKEHFTGDSREKNSSGSPHGCGTFLAKSKKSSISLF